MKKLINRSYYSLILQNNEETNQSKLVSPSWTVKEPANKNDFYQVEFSEGTNQ